MNEPRQQVVDQCRSQGMTVLTKEEFETTFLFDPDAHKLSLTHFCQSHDLELIVDAEAGRFFFLQTRPDDCAVPAPGGYRPSAPTRLSQAR